ncbi:MAG: hypothetical protein JJE25_04090 [Bacteroidia bacterium]|nr:hypothetical protein [Bacteroidia bacterium]
MANKIHCSLNYHRKAVDSLDEFATGVLDDMTANAALYPPLPVLPPPAKPLATLIGNYTSTRIAYERGGLDQKQPFIDAKNALIAELDRRAAFVDANNAAGTALLVTKAGFVPTAEGTTHTVTPEIPTGKVDRQNDGARGVIVAEATAQKGTERYGCLCVEGTPLTSPAFVNGQLVLDPNQVSRIRIDMNKGRKKKFELLTSGAKYYVYFFSGNATGTSALSDPKEIVAP